jgi:hypothetical protein
MWSGGGAEKIWFPVLDIAKVVDSRLWNMLECWIGLDPTNGILEVSVWKVAGTFDNMAEVVKGRKRCGWERRYIYRLRMMGFVYVRAPVGV